MAFRNLVNSQVSNTSQHFDVLGICIFMSVHAVTMRVRIRTYRRGLGVACSDTRAIPEPRNAEQQQCSPAFFVCMYIICVMENIERNYFLHRITGGKNASVISQQLLTNGYLSIGWSDFSSDEFIKDVQNRKIKAIEDAFNKHSWSISKSRWNLYRFIVDMKPGDYVLVPAYKSFSIYEIENEIIYSNFSLNSDVVNKLGLHWNNSSFYINNYPIDLGFYRKVKEVAKNIPRASYAEQKLISRMKIRQTNAWINDLKEHILFSIKQWEEQKPIILKNEIIEGAKAIVLKQIQNKIDDGKFEILVEWYLKSLGATVETPAKNSSSHEEGDADKIAIFDKLRLIILVQIKKHTDITGDWAVQQITNFKKIQKEKYHVDDPNAEYTTLMWVVSSGEDFSNKAKLKASENNVRLINGEEFAQLILENGLENMPL